MTNIIPGTQDKLQPARFASLSLIVLSIAVVLPMTSLGDKSAISTACTAREYHQFDFWIGDWDVFEENKPAPVAHARVDRILDGCVLREDYQNNAGLKGQSFSIYDASRKLWHQSWVTNRGDVLVIEGSLNNGEMVLSGADRAPDGGQRQIRGTWKALDGGVRETAIFSFDGGKTWKPWFDLMFRPHPM